MCPINTLEIHSSVLSAVVKKVIGESASWCTSQWCYLSFGTFGCWLEVPSITSKGSCRRAGCAVPWVCHCAPEQQLKRWHHMLLLCPECHLPAFSPSLFACPGYLLLHQLQLLPPQNAIWAVPRLLAGAFVPACHQPQTALVPLCWICTTFHHNPTLRNRTIPFSLKTANVSNGEAGINTYSFSTQLSIRTGASSNVSKSDRSINSKESRHLISGYSKIQFQVRLSWISMENYHE